jgi:hypothetical protein
MRTPVVSLGESGLATPGVLSYRLYREDVDPPTVVDVSAIVATEEGSTGDYYFSGVAITDGQRGSLVIAKADTPLAALATLSLQGPATPPVVVYLTRTRIDPLGPFKQHDNLGSLAVVIESGLPATISGSSAEFTMRTTREIRDGDGALVLAAGAFVIDHADAAIQGVALTDDGSYGCTLAYQFTQAATLYVGTFEGEFVIEFPPGEIYQHIPSSRYIEFRIEPSLEAAD